MSLNHLRIISSIGKLKHYIAVGTGYVIEPLGKALLA
jgi:hypothetical protein